MVSVIIPCYNSAAFVWRAIESVFRQTCLDWELLLVDNGSTDGTQALLETYARQRPAQVRVFTEPKKGAPAARNKGLHEAKGAWLQFLDADDELLPEKLQTQLKIAAQTKGNVVVGNLNLKFFENAYKRPYAFEESNVWRGFIRSRLGKTSSFLWRRSAVLEAGGWDENRNSSQEYELLFRILQLNDAVSFCSERHTNIYKEENSIQRTADKVRIADVCRNNIQLRLDVRNYLKATGKLTRKLDYDIKAYIYSYLEGFREMMPGFGEATWQELHLKLPFSFFVKKALRRMKYKSQKYIMTAVKKKQLPSSTARAKTAVPKS